MSNASLGSTHALLAFAFNLLVCVNAVGVFLGLRHVAALDQLAVPAVLIVVFLLVYAGSYALRAYRQALDALQVEHLEASAAQAILHANYLSFRLYLVALGSMFVLLAAANMALKKL